MPALGSILLIILFVSALVAVIEFLVYVNTGERPLKRGVLLCVEFISIIICPVFFLMTFDSAKKNDCCSETAFFSPDHRTTIYVLTMLCTIAYSYSTFRKQLAAPILELIINCFLITGIVLNVFIVLQIKESMVWITGNIPIIALFLSQLYKNQQMIYAEVSGWDNNDGSYIAKTCKKLLKAKYIFKYPVLLILCLPLLALLSIILLVFGQKPDSAIRAFTDTYRQGLSQLDYMCDNVQCGEHYLCSVAANGHSKIVKPERYGERNGSRIICNRQLLIANAFEELIEQKFPHLHLFLRKQYNKVGNMVHRHYKVFKNKFFSDIIYLIMKPVEYFFLIVLYLFDRKPENRIAVQYLNRVDRAKMGR